MNARPRIDMAEATRLTREGRLDEAMDVLRGASRPVSPAGAGDTDCRRSGGPSRILDREPPSTATGDAGPLRTPQALRGLVDRLAQHRPARSGADRGRTATGTARAVLPDGARFDERSFVNGAGRRTYKLYVPSGYAGQPLPLVLMLHGCTQSPDDFAAGTRMNHLAEEQTFIVAYPAQPRSANAQKCWNWFSPGDQQRDRGEPSLIAGITRQITRDLAVEPGRIYVAGLSAGGAKAAIMGTTYPDLFAAIGVHSGLACGAAHDLASALGAMRQGGPRTDARTPRRDGADAAIPTIVFHGDGDSTVSPVNGDRVIAQSRGGATLRTMVIRGRTSGGLDYTRTIQRDDRELAVLEQWVLHGAGHAWSGGSPDGSYTEPRGPDASREMMRFFRQHTTAAGHCG